MRGNPASGRRAFSQRAGGRSVSAVLSGLAALALASAPAAAQEPSFRVRVQADAPLNAPGGWAGDAGEDVVVEADRPFRLRLETIGGPPEGPLSLQVSRNAGAWEHVEAQDFPHPMREWTQTFADDAIGTVAPGWSMAAGATGTLAVAMTDEGAVLRAAAAGAELRALSRAPWPLPEFSIAARLRLPAGNERGVALLFGYVDEDNYAAAHFMPSGRVRVVRQRDGHETLLGEAHAGPALTGWQEVELQYEDAALEIEIGDGAFSLTLPLADGLPRGQAGIGLAAGDRVDIAEWTLEGVARTPRASIVATRGYAAGAPTADLIHAAPGPFSPGAGVSLAEEVSASAPADGHSEFEWPLVIRRHADGPVTNEAGDSFAFRMVDGEGRPASATGRVELAIAAGHLGGTFVENPGRIGPWQATNGDLYFIMEPTETDNRFMMMKSVDGGRHWREMDGAHRPATGDLESVDSRLVGDRIEIIHQVTSSVRRHMFLTSDNAERPDSWAVRDEVAARGEAIAQTATMAMRSDGSIVAVYLADRLHYVVGTGQRPGDRADEGIGELVWSAPVELDPEAGFVNAGPQAIVGRGDVVHLAYFSDDGSIWYRRILPDGSLTARQLLARGAGTGRAEYGAVLPLAYDAAADTVIIAYRLADGSLWERRIVGLAAPGAPSRITPGPVITDAVDSQQPAADLVIHVGSPVLLFIDEDSRSIYSVRCVRGAWQKPELLVDKILGSWVRGNVLSLRDNSLVYGFIYDGGSDGGAGMNRFNVAPLSPR
ncbi:MAG: hypothetical protein DI637_01180 [Citromicrobium sp.]|nr:MAG: hypothetical protein DI637_01180 [Citromicrobium sp.]